MCHSHGSRFDITTGAVVNSLAADALGVYEAREQAGEIQVRVQSQSSAPRPARSDSMRDPILENNLGQAVRR
jgi:hypothetical protein